MESKGEIRKRVLELRNAMSREDIRRKSAALFDKIFSLKQYGEAAVVLAYMDFRNEPETGGFIGKCLADGKKVALPKVEPGRNLAVYLIEDVDRDTVAGYKGIAEPGNSTGKRLDPADIDLAVIPGVAFDCGKNRIGYGAGYYDRFLHKLKGECFKIGVAFSLQVVDAIPASGYDVPVDLIITEEGIIK